MNVSCPAGSGWGFVLSLGDTCCVVAQTHPVLGSCCENRAGVWVSLDFFESGPLSHLEFRPDRLQISPRSHLGSASDPFPGLCCSQWLWSMQRTVDGAGAPVGKEGRAQNPARASFDSSCGHRAGEGPAGLLKWFRSSPLPESTRNSTCAELNGDEIVKQRCEHSQRSTNTFLAGTH